MRILSYKMGEIKITERSADDLRWEMHFGMGALKEGRCYRKGQILFLSPAQDERPGYLKGEFLDHIKPLPLWIKTRYYCIGFHIRRCDTGKNVSEQEMRRWIDDPLWRQICEGAHQPHDPILKIKRMNESNMDVSYALKNYEIVIGENGMALWKKCGVHNRVNIGRCFMMEDILFIGPSESVQPNTQKRLFMERLNLLPNWDYTTYYSYEAALLDCIPEA
ncbi:hypothetical protein [Desulfatirhabdium butyrativorans]|uniref:hypothetical protein n=1 Tax=Desulfatirhabdium butyrativorans TaxID=340467 RepID=UPI000481FFE4|nr:hypothetical protein [Desulfatirhabdium butyrativorans]